MKKTIALSLAMLAAAAIAAPSFADDGAGREARTGTSAGWIGVDELSARLTELGYGPIREIERDDGRYEVETRDREGRKVELDVSRSGEILHTEIDDDRWDN